tara:strand:+ start:105 stop:731 length:627 start_codon:yes stop_codon:yes gene_type:complete
MNTADLAGALANSQVQETSGGGVSFLKMDFNTGAWTLGQDAEDVTGDQVLVNTESIGHGWILWSGGRPNKRMVSFTEQLPMQMDAIGKDTPSEARTFNGAMYDDQTQLSFDSNSYGGRKGVDTLLGQIKAHASTGSGFLYPLVELTSENYPGTGLRQGKINYNPVFEVVGWRNKEGNMEGEAAGAIAPPEAEEAPEPEVKTQRRKRRA